MFFFSFMLYVYMCFLLLLLFLECSYFQRCEGSRILGNTVEESSLSWYVGMEFLIV